MVKKTWLLNGQGGTRDAIALHTRLIVVEGEGPSTPSGRIRLPLDDGGLYAIIHCSDAITTQPCF